MIVVKVLDEQGRPACILLTSEVVSDQVRGMIAEIGWTICETAPLLTLPQLAVRAHRLPERAESGQR